MTRWALLLMAFGCAPTLPCDARVDGDGDGHDACADCDDADATVHPGADEVCNGVDDDCDGTPDDAAVDAAAWPDADGDGFGAEGSAPVCTPGEGFADNARDCDDGDAGVRPGAPETWDGRDEDCDGTLDRVGITAAATGLLYGEAQVAIGAPGRLAWGGDPDDDGVQDLIVASPTAASGGRAWVVSTAVFGDVPQPVDGRYALRITRTQACAPFDLACLAAQRSLAFPAGPARDVTGDGVDDVVIVTEGYVEGRWQGDAVVVAGGDERADRTDADATTRVLPLVVDLAITPGRPVAVLGDVDDTEGTDLIFASGEEELPNVFDTVNVDEGLISVFAHGLCRDAVCPGPVVGGGDALVRIWGAPRQRLGSELATGDLDGDGDDELIAGSPGRNGRGSVLVFEGGPGLAGISSSPTTGHAAAWAELRGAEGEGLGARGWPLLAGQVTDDAFADVLVRSPTAPTVHVWLRTEAGSPGVLDAADLPLHLDGPEDSAFGTSACLLPGLLVVGDPSAADGAGQVSFFAVRGAPDTPARWTLADAVAILSGEQAGDRLGSSLACGVDADDDGLGDLIVGAEGWTRDSATRRGALYLVARPVLASD